MQPLIEILPPESKSKIAPYRAKADRDFGFAPRGLRRVAAAFYVGVSPSKFDDWVMLGLMPQPKEVGGVVVWDRRELDDAFDALPERDREEETKWNEFKA